MDAAVSVTTVRKKHRRIGAGTVVIYLVLIFWAVLTIFPFVWVVLNSFKPSAEVLRSSFSLPETFTWMNYQTAFERLNVLRAYRYSFVISGTVTVGVMVFASLMAFGLTRYHFKGKELIRSLIVASLMFPVFSTIIPVFKMMVEWGLLNKSIAVILPQIAGNLSFATIVMTGFMQSIPLEMEEAAYMEGADVFKVFGKIIVPGLIIIILAVFAGVVYYQKKVEPEKELLKEMNYGVSSMKDYFSNYISLGNYKGLTYEITQDMWDESVSDETNEYNTAKKVAEDTDQVAYNLTGYVDDKKDSNITHKDQEVIIGENSKGALKIISDAIKGHKSGEEITIEGLNASDFATDGSDYSGKNVKFVAKIKSVSKLYVEKVTDKWVKENYYDDYGLENADDFYKWCKQSLIEDAKAELWSKVLESSVVNKYSETAYQRVIEEVDGDYNYNAEFFGMTTDEYLEINGMTEDDMEDEYMNALKSEMVMWAIVEKEGLANKITDEDIQNKWDELYQEGDFESEEDMKSQYTDEEIRQGALMDKAVDWVYDHAKVKFSYKISK